MFKKIVVSLGILVTLNSYSQEEIAVFDNKLKESGSSLKDVIPIVNEKTGDISLFLMDATKVYAYLLNDDFKVVKSISSDDKSRKYKILIGKSISNTNDYRIYLTNNKQNKFASMNFSYSNNSSSLDEFELASKNELLVQTATHNNQFFLISIIKNLSTLCLYKFNNEGRYDRIVLDFSSDIFLNRMGSETTLFKLCTENTGAYGLKKSIDVKKIEKNNPNSIEITSELSKFYLSNNSILLTLDDNKSFTQIVKINLDTFKKEVLRIKKPFLDSGVFSIKTNSFINEDNIYMIASTSDNFVFEIKNIETKETLKEYKTSANDSITFKNTPIIQKGGAYDNYREMEKTKKFLRKITNGNVGVSVYKINNNYQITFGGKQEIKRGGMMMPMGGFGIPIASAGAVTVFFNPTYFAYNSYTSSKSTHIKGLFDDSFNHVTGEIEQNVFDKINDSKIEKSTALNGETVFKYKDFYIVGDYLVWDKKYVLRKFKD